MIGDDATNFTTKVFSSRIVISDSVMRGTTSIAPKNLRRKKGSNCRLRNREIYAPKPQRAED
ncbi:hypothetical protein MPTK1_3g03450 [Marchantia polymorpha subsp. ruderalis]|uniref:Uncharacterized protein n=2 Tax=Marchantia polymorpha TaxID=3197 RepID=A0AAF6AX12_MARPO|nr:hypothetical protein MARPO_0022s0187 [Marchantia polymorpha]BBN04296.1 hypothetical protein Mp_3g03450 [Marchantia polymorpha subsp. ruderalis]|eukprot:PTQ44109.1 hypothetical protein MARPO_0022s0187 [Marchantia polymorpha]